ncbi:MAG: hypothetical protein UX09_C0004G0005 [Candidatus Uhrbacteria bacterium GW2011_GWE2_45_35]|uniref:Uncharacterized protein n=2 Tax=Candidatus Uhriibacteriota TaxID=1752732 RepID=A0A0G1JKZ3_9BACT|nr:MAG: hypothetical protein UW63_C0002G0023 [Candidatus Uhrbacteria bacterium GW2011_GWF2_44_350]KKU09085.1 MAG: hypothetical protein UX09_C0004G0005 [Candidatus Uhrbacteria bacterium GW2011_GWE2_45_35]
MFLGHSRQCSGGANDSGFTRRLRFFHHHFLRCWAFLYEPRYLDGVQNHLRQPRHARRADRGQEVPEGHTQGRLVRLGHFPRIVAFLFWRRGFFLCGICGSPHPFFSTKEDLGWSRVIILNRDCTTW